RSRQPTSRRKKISMPAEPVKTPGLKPRSNDDGSRRYYWFAPADALKLGYRPRADDAAATSVRIVGDDQTAPGREFIQKEAERLQGEAGRWGEERAKGKRFDGTWRALIGRYENDP